MGHMFDGCELTEQLARLSDTGNNINFSSSSSKFDPSQNRPFIRDENLGLSLARLQLLSVNITNYNRSHNNTSNSSSSSSSSAVGNAVRGSRGSVGSQNGSEYSRRMGSAGNQWNKRKLESGGRDGNGNHRRSHDNTDVRIQQHLLLAESENENGRMRSRRKRSNSEQGADILLGPPPGILK